MALLSTAKTGTLAKTLQSMVANSEITPGEAQHQAQLAGVVYQPPADAPPAPPAADPQPAVPPASSADTAPYVAPEPDASRGAPAGMPTLDQFMNQFQKEHKAKKRTDESFLQMNQATFDLKDLLGALSAPGAISVAGPGATAVPAGAVEGADSLSWKSQDDATLLGLKPPSFLQLSDPAALLEREAAASGSEALHRLAFAIRAHPAAARALLQSVAVAWPVCGDVPRPMLLEGAATVAAKWEQLAQATQVWAAESARSASAAAAGFLDDFVAQAEADAAWLRGEAATAPPAPRAALCPESRARAAVTAALQVLA